MRANTGRPARTSTGRFRRHESGKMAEAIRRHRHRQSVRDMLSDIAAMLTGSLGMLPSASLGEVDVKSNKRKALYEPVHGSGARHRRQGIANPIAMIASVRNGAALFL